MVHNNKFNPKRRGGEKVPYQCNKCLYIVYLDENDLPPTFCPNCAINEPKGNMICIDPHYLIKKGKKGIRKIS